LAALRRGIETLSPSQCLNPNYPSTKLPNPCIPVVGGTGFEPVAAGV
jgi:hypothetical protein